MPGITRSLLTQLLNLRPTHTNMTNKTAMNTGFDLIIDSNTWQFDNSNRDRSEKKTRYSHDSVVDRWDHKNTPERQALFEVVTEMEAVDESLAALKRRIAERREALTALRERTELGDEIDSLNAKIAQLEVATRNSSERNEELQRRMDDLRKANAELEAQCLLLDANFTITDNDNAKLQKAKEKLNIAVEITGIRWNYSAPDDVKGYIANKSTQSIHPFQFDNDSDATSKLWDLIEKTSTVDWSDLIEGDNVKRSAENKENIVTN